MVVEYESIIPPNALRDILEETRFQAYENGEEVSFSPSSAPAPRAPSRQRGAWWREEG